MDYGHELTEDILSDLEAEINGIYKEASQTAKEKAAEYTRKFAERDTIMREKLDKGVITEEEYKQWRLGKMTVGARYTAMEEALAEDMTNANKLAASAINGHLPDVYATNYNWATYDIEQNARMDTNFMIYDRQTVERLIRDKPDLLPMKAKIDIPKDLQWNKKQINNAITQGVLLGEGIPDIAKRLANVTDMNRKAAIRNARTMTTSAENGGRIDSYKRAIDMGIKITQEWLATKDNRTRHEHAMLDGQEVEVGKPFKVEGYEIMFPADPKAEPFLVYNCRCCLISNFKGFDYAKMDKYVEEKPMSYKEWEERHKAVKAPEKPVKPSRRPKTPTGWAFETADGYHEKGKAVDAINNIIENAPEEMQDLWLMNAPKLQKHVTEPDSRAYWAHGDKRVHMNGKKVADGDTCHKPYQTHFHEYMHNIDYLNNDGTTMFYSETWKDEKGRTLEDVIMGEWKKKFTVKRSEIEIVKTMFKDQLKAGGVGAEAFVRNELIYWRKSNNLKRDDARYLALKEKLDKCESSKDYYDFFKENSSILVSELDRKQYAEYTDKDKIKAYIKDIRSKHTLYDRCNLSDMMQKYTVQELDMDRPLGVGHRKDYFNAAGQLSVEAFAEFGESSFTNPEAVKLLKQELPESYETWQKMLKQLIGGEKK